MQLYKSIFIMCQDPSISKIIWLYLKLRLNGETVVYEIFHIYIYIYICVCVCVCVCVCIFAVTTLRMVT